MVYRHHGKWMYDFWKKGVRHRQGGYRTKQDASIAEVMARKNLKGMNSDFISLCESRLKELKTRRTDKWFQENKRLIDKLVTLWGKQKEITRFDVEQFLNQTTSHTNANAQLKMLKALFKHGQEREMWHTDPTERIKKFPVAKMRKYIPPLEDIQAVLSIAKPLDRLYLLCLAHSMGRVNAINQLKWTDIHPYYISLYTRKARNSDLKEITIPMNAVLMETIRQLPMEGEYVFINPKTGKPYVYRKRLLKGLCKKCTIQYFSFHAIRHLTASLLDSKGVPLTTIQKLLGHERATTTDIYLQELRGTTTEAVKQLEDIK
jgi:integrase